VNNDVDIIINIYKQNGHRYINNRGEDRDGEEEVAEEKADKFFEEAEVVD